METIFGWIMVLIHGGLISLTFVLSVWALIDNITAPARAFVREDKRTKEFWLLLNVAATAISLLGLAPLLARLFGWHSLAGYNSPIGIFVIIIPGIYLADVRPAIRSYRNKSGDNRGPGSRNW